MTRKLAWLAGGVFLMCLSLLAVAQTGAAPRAPRRARTPAPATVRMTKDTRILAALKQVSAAQLKANDLKLVSFGTRHTLSDGDPAGGRGIAAAREWIKSEFERYSQACDGCLEVK